LLNAKVVEDLAETRLMLESHTVFLAATKATDRDLEEAGEALDGMKNSLHRLEDFMRHDVQFHLTVARATQNSILESLVGATRGYLQAWMAEMLADSAPRNATQRAQLSVAEHERILQALHDRDPERARKVMTEHILSATADLKRHLASGGA
jgi:GntR family transcriptional repressor for pyruvate dehydrogenase complex